MKQTVAIVGGGTASLFLAAFLNPDRYEVTIFEQNKTLGRKFLVAGDGGFNLTNSEVMHDFIQQYTPHNFLAAALKNFNNDDLKTWLLSIGIPTYVGSSGRVFPEKGIKPIEVLKCIERQLINKKVQFKFNKTFTNWGENNKLVFNGNELVSSNYNVFALGGSSWKVTGSNGSWLNTFNKKGISTSSFRASNCSFQINWESSFIAQNEGKPLKNIAIKINSKTQKGEAVVTKFGLEGNAIYALSPEIQSTLTKTSKAIVYVDFKPTLSIESLVEKITSSQLSTTETLRQKIKLSNVVIALLKATLTKEEYLSPTTLANRIKNYALTITAAAPIDEAISTAGGINLDAVTNNFELKTLKNNFCIGEMLNWDAPTGGYLIQGCVSMGVQLAKYFNTKA